MNLIGISAGLMIACALGGIDLLIKHEDGWTGWDISAYINLGRLYVGAQWMPFDEQRDIDHGGVAGVESLPIPAGGWRDSIVIYLCPLPFLVIRVIRKYRSYG